MSVTLDPREVLACLNYLGYTNITARQLKEFMIDLKKLIKYEEWCLDNQNNTQYQQESSPQCPNEDIFNILHKSETVASLARKKNIKKPSNEQIIRLQIHKPCRSVSCSTYVPRIVIPQESDSDPCQSCSCTNECLQPSIASAPAPTTTSLSTRPESNDNESTTRPTSSKCPSGVETTVKTRPQSSRSSYIKPKVMAKPLKSDPVALYHQYKKEWDKIKFPGSCQHHDTRWAVREKLLGE